MFKVADQKTTINHIKQYCDMHDNLTACADRIAKVAGDIDGLHEPSPVKRMIPGFSEIGASRTTDRTVQYLKALLENEWDGTMDFHVNGIDNLSRMVRLIDKCVNLLPEDQVIQDISKKYCDALVSEAQIHNDLGQKYYAEQLLGLTSWLRKWPSKE